MWVSKITEDNLTNDVIDRLLFQGLNDNGENVDCIIVLGSIKAAKYRVPVAAKAFFAGRSEKIMLCGGKKRNFPSGIMTEADDTMTKRDNWKNTIKGTDRAKAEALNIVRCVNNGVIPDFQI